MKKTGALLMAGGLALTLSLSACGNDDDKKAAEAISASMMEENDEEFPVEQKQADCVGEGFVDKIGVDQLQEYGILTDDLEASKSVGTVTMEEKDADSAAEVLMGCVDARQMMLDQIGADDSMSEEQQKCVGDVLDEKTLTEVFSKLFQGKEQEAMEGLTEPMMECMMQ